jgi:hypothetical protein
MERKGDGEVREWDSAVCAKPYQIKHATERTALK